MKKLSLFVTLLLVVAMLAIPVLAAQTATVTVAASTKTAYRGDTITITVSTSTINSCTTGGFMFSFDKNVFEYVSGSALLSGYTAGVSNAAGNVAGYFMNGNATVQGNIFKITLKVKDSATFGTYTITGVPNLTAADGAVTCNVTGATVTVACKHNYGNWTKVNNTTHKHTCTVCSKEETANHTWNNGTVTKAATCKEEGVKTFTCTACSATKTEAIAKLTTHTYGNWTKVNNTTHKHTCSICSKEETANHTWNNGTVTKAATCKEEGVKTFTCTVCNGTKTESIAKLTTHTYGNWTKVNNTTHKHTCTVCSKEETANHTWNNGTVTKAATCKEEGVKTFTCTACSATKTEAIAKLTTHTYGNWTKVDETTHKHTCTVCSKEETGNHTWNNGAVTKAATCKEEGVKTFTCTVCNGTKTESIVKLTTHTYGSWTKADEATHKRTCPVCAKEETGNHTWNSGAVTKAATCKEEGVKTFTCTVCNGTKTESIAKLTTHTYDHACDTSCNICDLAREITHNYKTEWSKDKTNHWHECSVCKEKKDSAAHTPGAEATEKTAQTCTTCGYIITPALGHKHTYANTWTTDDAGHWYTCSGCEEKSSYAKHEFENACDKDCSVCGFTRETKHNFTTEWKSDKAGHWHACTNCGLKQEEAAHEPGAEATETTAQTCTICGFEVAPALGVKETEPTTTPSTPNEETKPTQSADPTEPKDEPTDDEKAGFPIWIPIVIVVAVAGAVAAIIVMKKKD